MTTYFYAIHDENGTRIDDDSDNPLDIANLDSNLASLAAERVQLPTLGTCWKVGDDLNGYQYLTIINLER